MLGCGKYRSYDKIGHLLLAASDFLMGRIWIWILNSNPISATNVLYQRRSGRPKTFQPFLVSVMVDLAFVQLTWSPCSSVCTTVTNLTLLHKINFTVFALGNVDLGVFWTDFKCILVCRVSHRFNTILNQILDRTLKRPTRGTDILLPYFPPPSTDRPLLADNTIHNPQLQVVNLITVQTPVLFIV